MELSRTQLIFLPFFLVILLSSALSVIQNSNQEGEDVERSQFPEKFIFGAATSSYQVEGAYLEDGKSLNNWDVFTHKQGTIKDGDNGDVADDHYHRYLEDIELINSLGVNAYRLSFSWARILPSLTGGRFGYVNPLGIMFYNKIIDNLLIKGIEPFVTIHHHDIPQELEDRYGSWLSPLIQEDFVHYADTCFKSFGNKVKYWTTINEPNIVADMAYIRGRYPPGHCSPPFGNCSVGNSDVEPLVVMHNMLLSHAKAVKLYREQYQKKQGGYIGIISNTFMYEPLRENEFDRQAVRRALAFNLAWVLDPVVYGDYPPEMRDCLGNQLPRFSPEETKFLKGSTDFIGINHYSTFYVKDCFHSSCASGCVRAIRGFVCNIAERDGVLIGEPTGMADFFVVPRGLEKTINYVKERYNNKPMFVTENGYSPLKQENEQVWDLLQDVKRIEFHKSYLAALARAMRNGADVRGYFIWSVMDNFEWAEGYTMRFGLFYVDRQTLKRIPKLSSRWYTSFLTNNSHNVRENITGSFRSKKFIVSGLKDERVDI